MCYCPKIRYTHIESNIYIEYNRQLLLEMLFYADGSDCCSSPMNVNGTPSHLLNLI